MIFLDQSRKLVHDCKADDALGVGITKCGRITFLTGTRNLKREGVFGAPAKEGSDGVWQKCAGCETSSFNDCEKKWIDWRRLMKDTLRIMARSQVGKTQEEVQTLEA